MYENLPTETKYIYTDDDSQGQQLDGHNLYTITFPKGQQPPVKGFWSLTLCDAEHFYNDNPLKRYSLGTKNKNKYDADGSLTLYAGAKSPGGERKTTGCPRLRGRSRSTSGATGQSRRRGTGPGCRRLSRRLSDSIVNRAGCLLSFWETARDFTSEINSHNHNGRKSCLGFVTNEQFC